MEECNNTVLLLSHCWTKVNHKVCNELYKLKITLKLMLTLHYFANLMRVKNIQNIVVQLTAKEVSGPRL